MHGSTPAVGGAAAAPFFTSLMSVICSLGPLDHTTRHFLTGAGRLSSFSTWTSKRNLSFCLLLDLWLMPRVSLPNIVLYG